MVSWKKKPHRARFENHETLFDAGALVFPNASEPLRYGPKTRPSLTFRFHDLPGFALWKPSGASFLWI